MLDHSHVFVPWNYDGGEYIVHVLFYPGSPPSNSDPGDRGEIEVVGIEATDIDSPITADLYLIAEESDRLFEAVIESLAS